jgi:hypothetical protein
MSKKEIKNQIVVQDQIADQVQVQVIQVQKIKEIILKIRVMIIYKPMVMELKRFKLNSKKITQIKTKKMNKMDGNKIMVDSIKLNRITKQNQKNHQAIS